MEYNKVIVLKNGKECLLRHGERSDGEDARKSFIKVHDETDFLTSYPDEHTSTAEDEGEFLEKQKSSNNSCEIYAYVDGVMAGSAGINPIGLRDKVKHRVDFGIGIEKAFWGLGIGRALTEACVECAEKAGYLQIELEVVADNANAVRLYESIGFTEYGRNPRGFRNREGNWQELVLMRKELR